MNEPIIDIRPGHYVKKSNLPSSESHAEIIRITGQDPLHPGYWKTNRRDVQTGQNIIISEFELSNSYTRMNTFATEGEMNRANESESSKHPVFIGDLSGLQAPSGFEPKGTKIQYQSSAPQSENITHNTSINQPISLESQLIDRCLSNEPIDLSLSFNIRSRYDINKIIQTTNILDMDRMKVADILSEKLMVDLKNSFKQKIIDVISLKESINKSYQQKEQTTPTQTVKLEQPQNKENNIAKFFALMDEKIKNYEINESR